MKISYNWLKQYISLDATPEKTGEWLTDTGLEVEGLDKVESIEGGLEGLVVGEVLTCEQHPNADRLSVTTVDVDADEPLHIVCGAPNVAAGQKVIVATVGTTLYPNAGESFKIKKGKIRGEVSEGMICAEDEIGLGSGHDGIMVLDPSAEAGMPAAQYFKIESDYVFEIGLTPNRVDAASHIGTARDLVALSEVEDDLGSPKLDFPDVSAFKVDSTDLTIPVKVEDTAGCPRYSSVSISGVTVKDSPEWLRNRLNAIGVRPINNVVDVTNYVLHEVGHPLHAFDADKIKGGEVLVKTLSSGTSFTTLDEAERKLDESDLMICNKEGGMCIAGVFGGSESGVSDATTKVFLESAYFNPVRVRKTAKRHGLNTDASFRFERGADPDITVYALKRAALLIQEVAGGSISSEIADFYPEPIAPFNVTLRFAKCDAIIGKSIERDVIKRILVGLSITVVEETSEGLKLEVPAFKADVTREIDIIEEVLRIYGYNNIELPEKLSSSLSYTNGFDLEKVRNRVADALAASGWSEAMHNSLTSSGAYNEDEAVRLVGMANPLSRDLDVMRGTLMYQMLETVVRNSNHKQEDLRLFEFGKTYGRNGDNFYEEAKLLLCLTGMKHGESWISGSEEVSFFSLKSRVNQVLSGLGLDKMSVSYKESDHADYAYGLELAINNKKVGVLGAVSKNRAKQAGLKKPVFMAELSWDRLLDLASRMKVKFEPVSKFPAVRRDLALLLDKDISFEALKSTAMKSEKKLLQKVDLFDVYEGNKLPKGKKSYALSFILRNDDKTLVDKQVDKVMDKILKEFTAKHGAELRA